MQNHDPVTALSEADATGRTAEIFGEIREVLQIPLVTSIWRTLAGIEEALEATWASAKPIYQSGQPEAILSQLVRTGEFPAPEAPSTSRLEAARLYPKDMAAIVPIVDAYNRSNGLNLMALTALIRNDQSRSVHYSSPPAPAQWPTLLPLLAKEQIGPANWSLLEQVSYFGSNSENPAMPTFWRHLVHWPGLLELVLEMYGPMQRNGTLYKASEQVALFATSEAVVDVPLNRLPDTIPTAALRMIEDYVGDPGSVTRMVTIGTSVANWLPRFPVCSKNHS